MNNLKVVKRFGKNFKEHQDITIHTWNDKRNSKENEPELITSKKHQDSMYSPYSEVPDKARIANTSLIAHKTYKKIPKEQEEE